MTKLIHALFLTITVALLTSCSASRRINKCVNSHYNETSGKKIRESDYITFRFENPIPQQKMSETQTLKNHFIPALFYWRWKYETAAKLNTMPPATNFASSFITAASTGYLKEILQGGSVQITLRNNPADFKYHDDGWVVYGILAYAGNSRRYVEPLNAQFEVEYTFVFKNGERRTGIVTLDNQNQKRAPRGVQGVKGMIREYLVLSDANVQGMAQDLAEKLVGELVAGKLVRE